MAVRIEKDPERKIATVILDNPEVRNAVDRDTARALAEAFREFEADDALHVAVLWGAGGCFCSGANLKAIAAGRANDWNAEGDGPMGPSRMMLAKPVIAAVAGYAVAGGLELAVLCDMRVVEEDAIFGVFCRRWGVPLVDGGTIRLPRLIGHSHALDMILTGRPVGAEEALRMGLANRVVPRGRSREEAEKLAAQIAAYPQVTMRNDRLSSYEQWGMSLEGALKNEFARGQASQESGVIRSGAGFFSGGAGRHGDFKELPK